MRNEGDLKQALAWFERAFKLGDDEAHLEIAKIHLKNHDRKKATRHLKLILKAKPYVDVTQDSREQAQRILRRLKTKAPQKLS